jgi:hypothetical protein
MNLSDLPISRLSVEETSIMPGAYYAAQSGESPAIIAKCLSKNKYDITPVDRMYMDYKKKECFLLNISSSASITALQNNCKKDYLNWLADNRSGVSQLSTNVDLSRLSDKFVVRA